VKLDHIFINEGSMRAPTKAMQGTYVSDMIKHLFDSDLSAINTIIIMGCEQYIETFCELITSGKWP